MASKIPVLILLAVCCSVCWAALISDMKDYEFRSFLKDVLAPEPASPPCEDTSLYQDCHRVVLDRLCTRGLHYAHYCCQSCLKAGQVDRFGPHTNKGVKAPLVVEVDREEVEVQRGEDVTLTCSASGYPAPEVGWISPKGNPLLHGTKYLITRHYNHTPVVRTVVSTLTVRNFSYDDAGRHVCLAVTPHDHTSATTTLVDHGRLQLVLRSQDRIVDYREPMGLECVVKAARPPIVVEWKFDDRTIDDDFKFRERSRGRFPDPFTVFVNSTGPDEEGLVTVYSSLSVNSSHYKHEGQYTCLAHNGEARKEWHIRVYVEDASNLAANCTDINREECYRVADVYNRYPLDPILSRECRNYNYLPRYCCRTCTLTESLRTTGSHLQHVSKDMTPSLSINGDEGHYLGTSSVTCSVEGIPTGLTLAWFKENAILEDSPKYTIEEIPTDHPYFTRKLRLYVQQVSLADAGNYTCTASVPASTPAALSVVLRFDSQATFSWQ